MNDTSAPGTYVVLFRSRVSATQRIGRLGELDIVPGYYLYVGSAYGPGGVAARIRHHVGISTRPHWHLDYLRLHCAPVEAWYVPGLKLEHEWAKWLLSRAECGVPLRGFGASDCRCRAHLFFMPGKPDVPGLLPAQGLLQLDLRS